MRTPIPKQATVYLRRGDILVHANSRTTDGVWIVTEPCVRLPSSECSDGELGETVMSILEHSHPSVPHPRQNQWPLILEPLLKAAGVRTWKAFVTGTACVEVEADGRQFSTLPNINHGARDGFLPDEANRKSITLPTTPDTIGSMLRATLASAN